MTWITNPDPTQMKRREYLRALILAEIDTMSEEQLALAIVIAREARAATPEMLALLEARAQDGPAGDR